MERRNGWRPWEVQPGVEGGFSCNGKGVEFGSGKMSEGPVVQPGHRRLQEVVDSTEVLRFGTFVPYPNAGP